MSHDDTAKTDVPMYEPLPDWGRVPLGLSLAGDATSVAVDSDDNVYVFNRGTAPVVVLDREGNFLESWGAGDFDKPHGIFIDDNDDLYLVDAGGHFVQKRTREGKVLLTIGTRGEAAPPYSGGWFNEPTDLVVHPVTRELFIADGYRNTAVHRFSPEGQHLATFGGTGCGNGLFSLPHGIELVDDLLFVSDRENYLVQVFTTSGVHVDEWHAHKPCTVLRENSEDRLYVAELGVGGSRRALNLPNFGHRVSIRTLRGTTIGALGAPLPGFEPDQFFAPHDLAIDSHGDLYVAEVNCSFIATVLNQPYPMLEPPSLRKWRRVGVEPRASQ